MDRQRIGTLLFLAISACSRDRDPKLFPRAHVDSATLDFADCCQGESIERSFSIQNTGDAPLEILAIHPSCGCLAVQSDHSAIRPNGKVAVTLAFDTAKRLGPQTVMATVMTNDPSNPRIRLELKGRVVRLVDSEPDAIDFEEVFRGESSTKTIALRSQEGAFSILGASCEDSCIRVGDLTSCDAPASTDSLTIELSPDSPVGWFGGTDLVIRLHHARQSELRVPIRGRVIPDVVIDPSYVLDLGHVRRGETVNKLVRIRNRGLAPLVVEKAEIESSVNREVRSASGVYSDLLSVSLIERKAGEEYDADVRFVAKTTRTQVIGRLAILTNKTVGPTRFLTIIGRTDD